MNPHYYGACSNCIGQGYLYWIERRVRELAPGVGVREERLRAIQCVACCGVGYRLIPGRYPGEKAEQRRIERMGAGYEPIILEAR